MFALKFEKQAGIPVSHTEVFQIEFHFHFLPHIGRQLIAQSFRSYHACRGSNLSYWLLFFVCPGSCCSGHLWSKPMGGGSLSVSTHISNKWQEIKRKTKQNYKALNLLFLKILKTWISYDSTIPLLCRYSEEPNIRSEWYLHIHAVGNMNHEVQNAEEN